MNWFGQHVPPVMPAATHRVCTPQCAATVGDADGEPDGLALGIGVG